MVDADKGQFDEVLRRMIRKNPQKTSEIKRSRSKKNPHEGPLPDDYQFDGQPLTAEQIAEVEWQKKLFAQREQEQKKKR